MARKRQSGNFTVDLPVRIPVPERLEMIKDPIVRKQAMEAHWESYGYSDRFVLTKIEEGHFFMIRK